MLNMSPLVFEAPPPSPACIVIPGTLRIASVSVVAPCSSRSARGMTWIVCGVSTSGAEYLADSTRGSAPLTWTASELRRISTVTVVAVGEAVADARTGEERVRAPARRSAIPADAGRWQRPDAVLRERHRRRRSASRTSSAPSSSGPGGIVEGAVSAARGCDSALRAPRRDAPARRGSGAFRLGVQILTWASAASSRAGSSVMRRSTGSAA